jgi:hypothetical protein
VRKIPLTRVMGVTNKPLKISIGYLLGREISRKYTYTLCVKYCLKVTNCKDSDGRNSEVIFDKFNIE